MAGINVKTLGSMAAVDFNPTQHKFIVDDGTRLLRMSARDILRGAGLKSMRLCDHASIEAARTAHISGGSVPTVFTIDKDDTVNPSGSSLTLPSTMIVAWDNVSKVTVANGKTLTISSMPDDPGSMQRFVLGNSSSHVLFAGGAVERINTAWWTGPGSGSGVTIDRAMTEALLSVTGNVGAKIYTPWGLWNGAGNFLVPGHVDLVGDGKYATVFQNTSSTTPFFKIIPNTQFVTFNHLQINGIIGASTSGCGILLEGAVADEVSGTGFIGVKSCIIQSNHWGFKINATDGNWSAVDIEIDKDSALLGNDWNTYNNSSNTNLVNHAHELVSWIPTGGGAGYSQYLGDLIKTGPFDVHGEKGGMWGTGGGYGKCQRQMITVQAGDNVTGAGTAICTVHAAGMLGDGNSSPAAMTYTVASSLATTASSTLYTGHIVRVSSTGAIFTGLLANTDYYWIRVSATTGRFASSLANAIAGTYITLSGGSGTQTVTPQALALGSPVTINVPLTTADNTVNKIAARIRYYLGHNPWISSFFHTTMTWTGDNSLDSRVNLIAIEPAATDTTMAFSWVHNDVTGLTDKTSSTQTAGSVDKLAMGYKFSGGHYGTVFQNVVDEGFATLIQGDADEIESQYMFVGGIIQSPVRLNKKCVLKITGTEVYDRCIRDGGSGPVGSPTWFGSPRVMFDGTVQLYSNVWVDDGAGNKVGSLELMQCRRDSNFANIQYDDYNNGMYAQRIDHHENLVESNYNHRLFYTPDQKTADLEALVPSLRAQLDLISFDAAEPKDMLFIGNGDTRGFGRFGYGMRRIATGALRVKTNQTGYGALETDHIYAPGFVSEIKTDCPNITADTIDYNPTTDFAKTIMQVRCYGGDWILRSMLAPLYADGVCMKDGWNGILTNTDPDHWLTIPHEDTTGGVTTRMRFWTPQQTPYFLGPQCSVGLYYDILNSRWIIDDNFIGERLLARSVLVDLNASTAVSLYTVPTGRELIVTREVIRKASTTGGATTSLTTASWSSGFNSSSYNDVIADATHTELTGNTLFTTLLPKIGAKKGVAADILKIKPNTLQGAAATVLVDVFGELL